MRGRIRWVHPPAPVRTGHDHGHGTVAATMGYQCADLARAWAALEDVAAWLGVEGESKMTTWNMDVHP